MTNRTQTRYITAIFFILCGLIIGIAGSYSCILKHYNGGVPLASSAASELRVAYPDRVSEIGPTLRYDIYDTKLLDLPYKANVKLLWLVIPIGLAYTVFGIVAMLKKGLIFRKEI